MEFGRKMAVVVLPGVLMLAVALTSVGCGGSSSGASTTTLGMSTTSTAAPTATSSASTTVSAQKQAAEAYFTAMAPTIEKDYQGMVWFEAAAEQWEQKYGATGLSTSLAGWTAILPTFEQVLAKEQPILKGYEAVTPPQAFKTAHAALLKNNLQSNSALKAINAAIKAKRPASELMSMLQAAATESPTNAEVLADFQAAAASVGVSLPAKFISAYQDDSSSGQTTS